MSCLEQIGIMSLALLGTGIVLGLITLIMDYNSMRFRITCVVSSNSALYDEIRSIQRDCVDLHKKIDAFNSQRKKVK